MTVCQPDAGGSCQLADVHNSPGVNTRLAAVLATVHGEVTGRLVNISRTGLCVESDQALADLLLAGVSRKAAAASVIVQLSLARTAGAAGAMPVRVQARTIYVIHDHGDIYRCGLEFMALDEGEAAFASCLYETGLSDPGSR